MSSSAITSKPAALAEEIRKLPAFFRRDVLVRWSYRTAFLSDWISLLVQVLIFSFVGRLVDPASLPSFGGTKTSYIEFVSVGIALGSFMQIGIARVAQAVRQEQLQGTLEVLLLTPTALATVQLGSAIYDVAYVPVRTAVFLALVSLSFGVHFDVGGLLPALAVLVTFVPVVWGLGMISAGAVLTFRQGSGIVGLGATFLTIGSGTYFPVGVLPGWAQGFAAHNPITVALDAMRLSLLAEGGWEAVWPAVATLLPMAVVTLCLGVLAFRLALGREIRRGTLGLY